MKINAFTCCVNYDDVLRLMYPINKIVFNTFTVVTSETDTRTQQYCLENDINLIVSNDCYKDGAAFNKAAMLNKALEFVTTNYSSPDDWYLAMDCDIIVNTCLNFENMELDKNKVYGSKRIIVEDVNHFKNTGEVRGQYQFMHWSYPFAQMGYFQLFKKFKAYFDEKYDTASHCDTDFFIDNWGRENAIDFHHNDLVCIHLGPIETNWSGRVTKRYE